MDETKLKKLGAELEKARARQAEWTAKVKELERKYREAENTCIHDIVHAADAASAEAASERTRENEEREVSENE